VYLDRTLIEITTLCTDIDTPPLYWNMHIPLYTRKTDSACTACISFCSPVMTLIIIIPPSFLYSMVWSWIGYGIWTWRVLDLDTTDYRKLRCYLSVKISLQMGQGQRRVNACIFLCLFFSMGVDLLLNPQSSESSKEDYMLVWVDSPLGHFFSVHQQCPYKQQHFGRDEWWATTLWEGIVSLSTIPDHILFSSISLGFRGFLPTHGCSTLLDNWNERTLDSGIERLTLRRHWSVFWVSKTYLIDYTRVLPQCFF